MKSSTVVSSARIVKKPKHSAAASGRKNLNCTIATTDTNADILNIVKSHKLQSHKLAGAFKFCGYKYVIIPFLLTYKIFCFRFAEFLRCVPKSGF